MPISPEQDKNRLCLFGLHKCGRINWWEKFCGYIYRLKVLAESYLFLLFLALPEKLLKLRRPFWTKCHLSFGGELQKDRVESIAILTLLRQERGHLMAPNSPLLLLPLPHGVCSGKFSISFSAFTEGRWMRRKMGKIQFRDIWIQHRMFRIKVQEP